MQKEEFIDIANKVSEGLATDQEKQLFLFHLGTFAKQNSMWEKLVPEFRQQMEDEIKSNIRAQVFGEDERKFKTVKLWPRIVAVAAAVALVFFGVYFFNYRNDQHTDSNVLTTQDVAPGTVGATLTLANGKKIKLSDAVNGEIAKEAGISVTKTTDGQLVYEIKKITGNPTAINTLSTAKGETYILTLPDKSKVWLNAASSLTYSATLLERGVRRVKLEGEGYFEVAKDKAHPFVVESAGQKVEVLGTHFNINSYADEGATVTTLIEGSVRVMPSARNTAARDIILKPNQQSSLSNNQLIVGEANANAVAWINGKFRFYETPLQDIMKELARWYDVEVVYQDGIPDRKFTGGINRNVNASEALSLFQFSGIQFRIEGKKIIVSNKTKSSEE